MAHPVNGNEAHLQEFSPDDDVCLVVKHLGADTFYRFGNLRCETNRARDDYSVAEIFYFNRGLVCGTSCQSNFLSHPLGQRQPCPGTHRVLLGSENDLPRLTWKNVIAD